MCAGAFFRKEGLRRARGGDVASRVRQGSRRAAMRRVVMKRLRVSGDMPKTGLRLTNDMAKASGLP